MTDHRSTKTGVSQISVFSRRDLILGTRAAGLLLWLAPVMLPSAIAEDTAPPRLASARPDQLSGQTSAEDTLRRLLKGARPVDGKVNIELPEIAENGNVVPIAVTVDSPMTDVDFVKTVHIVSAGNPQPLIGSFHFSALSGRASVTTRMRLAKSQDLFVLVEHSTGRFVLAQRTVKVTIGGCGGG
jgi:sulfur-oxidizing protein SoxY